MRQMRTSSPKALSKASLGQKSKRHTSPQKKQSCSSSSDICYKYEPLPSRTSIRILTLQPGEDSDKIRCQVSAVERDQAPPYNAISYAWGSPTNTRAIYCGEKILKVTRNLWDALKIIRKNVGFKPLWADAVCIDQSNEEEREQQVKQMGSIYANAERVLVWLGSPSICKDGLGNLDSLSDPSQPYTTSTDNASGCNLDLERHVATLESWDVSKFRVEELDEHSCYIATAFAQLFTHPWFFRLWVVQEVGVSRLAIALIGDFEIEFGELMRINRRLRSRRLLADHFGWNASPPHIFSIFPRMSKEIYPEADDYQFDFLEILYRTRDQVCSDPRDRIYGLLGHPAALIRGVPIVEPDYNVSATELFFEIAIKLIKETQNLRVLSAVYHKEESDLGGKSASWIPTWSRDGFPTTIAVRNQYYDAAAGESLEWKLMDNTNVLRVRGFVFDSVDEYTEHVDHKFKSGSLAGQESARIWPIHIALQFRSRTAFSLSENLTVIYHTLTLGATNEKGLSQNLADFSAFRLHLFNEASRQGNHLVPDMAPEGIATLQAASKGGNIDGFLEDAGGMTISRKLFSTQRGMFGLGPSVLREGDLCCIIFGASVPFILRPVKSRYRLVGEAYVHGVMYGEAMKEWIQAKNFQDHYFEIF